MYLSIVIPAYNEEQRIGPTLQQVVRYLGNCPYDSEVIVVDDGSHDQTAAVARTFTGHPPPEVRVISYRSNGGKGFAVRTGMEAARGSFRMYYDADASTPVQEVDKLWPEFDDGADVVLGSRALPESDVQIHQAFYRESMGRIFNLLLRAAGLTHFRDTQCGFKAFTARAAETLFHRQVLNRYSFDAEVLYLAQRAGMEIREVPVIWRNSPHSSVNPISDAMCMFFDLLRIRLNTSLRRYDGR